MNRIPTLDGWRGIAILLVLFDHLQDSLLGRYAYPWTQTGQHGVTIFFVLSGFLITSKLSQGPIDLKRFFIGRFFRLMPAAWVFLATLLVIDGLTGIHFTSLAGVSSCLFFYRNYMGNTAGAVTGHFWSLAVEAQFYLVWPCILLLAGMRRSRAIAVAGALACAAYRWAFWEHYNRNLLNGQTQVRADALLVGCALALFVADARTLAFLERWSKLAALPALACLIFCAARFHWLPPLLESISIAALIAFTALSPTSLAARWLSLKPMAFLGTISYSLYLWQELFMSSRSPVALFIVMPIVALASYAYIEQPSIQLGRRIFKTSSRRPLAGNSGQARSGTIAAPDDEFSAQQASMQMAEQN